MIEFPQLLLCCFCLMECPPYPLGFVYQIWLLPTLDWCWKLFCFIDSFCLHVVARASMADFWQLACSECLLIIVILTVAVVLRGANQWPWSTQREAAAEPGWVDMQWSPTLGQPRTWRHETAASWRGRWPGADHWWPATTAAETAIQRTGCMWVIYFASAAVAVDFSHMTALSSASWSRFSPPSNFVNGHVSTMWFIVCRWPQSHKGDWATPHLYRLARHGPWPCKWLTWSQYQLC